MNEQQLAAALGVVVTGLESVGGEKGKTIATYAGFLVNTFLEGKAALAEGQAIAEETRRLHDAGWPEDEVHAILQASHAQRHADLARLDDESE